MKIHTTSIRFIIPFLVFTSCQSKHTDAQGQARHAKEEKQIKKESVNTDAESHWVDSVYNSLNEEERIGQLFMVAAYSGGENANQAKIESLVAKHQIGGIIFMQGTPEAQVRLTNKYQQMAQAPLLIGMDAEWGLGMRLTGVKNFPRQMMLGATRDEALMEEVGKAIAAQCKRVGVQVDFAPDIDVNNNPRNPVINFRSFGDNKEWVAKMGVAYTKGLQGNGVMACAKHFPGHGDVATDSHLDLPVIKKTKEQLQETELYPFRKLSEAGVGSMMIAHLSVPSLDNTPNLPTTLSHKVVTDLLKDEIGFKGLIFTDALNMKGVTKYFPNGETDLRAFLAGNDVLLFSQDVPLAISKIKAAIASGQASEKQLEQSVKKILAAKYQYGLSHFTPLSEANVTADVNKDVDRLSQKVARAAVTIANDNKNTIAALQGGKTKVAYVSIGTSSETSLSSQLKSNGFAVNKLSSAAAVSGSKNYDAVIVGVHNIALYPGKSGTYGIDASEAAAIKQLSPLPNVIIVYFGNAYTLKNSCNAAAVIAAYDDNSFTQQAVADVLSGKLKAKGVLPVSACK